MYFNISHFKIYTAQKMKISIKDFFSKYDQIRIFLRICLHVLNKSLIENLIFCAVLSQLIHSVPLFSYLSILYNILQICPQGCLRQFQT